MNIECDTCLLYEVSLDKCGGVFICSCAGGKDIDHTGDCDAYMKDESIED